MRIYTRTGDDGTTAWLGGGRTGKGCAWMDAIGDLDELGAALGQVIAAAPPGEARWPEELRAIQRGLMAWNAHLARGQSAADADAASAAPGHAVPVPDVAVLEQAIDAMSATLKPLHRLILPGGDPAAAAAHTARAVCRRAERAVVRLLDQAPLTSPVRDDLRGCIVYLNRLSDYLFTLARHINHVQGVPDQVWLAD